MSENPGAEFFSAQDERLAKAVRHPKPAEERHRDLTEADVKRLMEKPYVPEPPRRDPRDEQAAFYEHLDEEARGPATRDEAVMGWIEAKYSHARRMHEGGTLRDAHLAGLKAVWESAADVAEADTLDEQPYSE